METLNDQRFERSLVLIGGPLVGGAGGGAFERV